MNNATLEKLNAMRLYGMAQAFKNTIESKLHSNLTTDEVVGFLVDAEWDDRYNRKLQRLFKNACFRYDTAMQQIDFSTSRNLDKNQLLRFSNGDWIKRGENIIVTGPTGVGKSFIASALGHQVCINGFKVLYYNSLKLFSNLKFAKADGSYNKEIKKLQKQDLIILDDFGIEPFDAKTRLMLLEIIEDRHGFKSMIISSQISTDKWFDCIGDPTIADAVCDRIIHSSFKINLKGESMRKTKSKKLSTKNAT